ncbi:MAG: hypothetical protein JNK76_24545 [Planctomycetales bacterium]|nr:hypothetical protein [Planctomycetales bacterium]MBN8627003.1 hypothetical protein [Planctomycetota bacterium]
MPSPESEVTPAYLEAVERLTQHVQVVQEILDEIREELQWAVRNQQPIRLDRIPQTLQEWSARLNPERRSLAIEELLTCQSCDRECDSLRAALEEGWENLVRHDGPSWNFLGMCPECLAEERAAYERLHPTENRASPVDDSPGSVQRELF